MIRLSCKHALASLHRLRCLSVLAVFALGTLVAGCGSHSDGTFNGSAQTQLKMGQPADWSVVTTTTVGDGYVQYGDATFQWLDARCVATLKAQGLPVDAIQWSQLATQSQLEGAADCETVRVALSQNSGDTDGIFPDTPSSIVSTGGADGYVLYLSRNRHWLSAQCMAQLRAAQLPVLRVSWEAVSDLPQLAGQGNCDDVEQVLTDQQQNPTPAWRIVTTNNEGDGYVLYPGNVRRWLSASCIDRLKRNGISVTQIQWSQISGYYQEATGKCSDLLGNQIERNDGGWAVVTTTDNGDGYLLTPNNELLWLSAQCVQSLRNDQLAVSAAQWEDIAEMQQIGLGDCNTARTILGGEDRPSAFDLFMMEQLGLTFAQWRHYTRLEQELRDRMVFGEFERQLGDAFAGAYLERGADGFHNYVVAIKGDQALQPVNGYLPDVVKRVKYSLNDLAQLRVRIQSIVPFGEDMDVWSIGTDITRNAISLGAGIGASGPVRRLLDQYSFPQDAVVIEESAGRPRFN